MKKILNFAKKKKHPPSSPDNRSGLSVGYEFKEKDLGKVHKAALVGDLSKLKQLAKKNDVNQLDKENRTALHIACASGHVEVVQFLVESKAKLNLCDNQNRSALMKAVQGQHERCVSILLENRADPNHVDINGNTALHLAANIPSISTTVLLLEHAADINAQNKEGFTPLTVSVREDHFEMAEFLLNKGAGVNVMDQAQRSPLMHAARNGHSGMLQLLLRFEADITLKDNKGWSADEYAVMNGHHPCSLLIIEHGTQMNDGPSLSNQGPGKKKKKPTLGSPSQDAEARFSLGGPASDKDEHGTNEAGGDFEDNSQSESLSRVSKNAADEWPSSEDDGSVLIEKNPQKVNLRKMIASKRGEDSQEKDTHVEQPSSSKARSDCQEGSPEAEDSEEEVEEEEEGEEEEEEEEEGEEEEEEEEEEDEEEEEEEEDDDEEDEEEGEDEEEESEEQDEEEITKENECDEKDNDKYVASVEAVANEFKEIQKTSVPAALKTVDSADAQNTPGSDVPHSHGTSPAVVSEDLDAETEAKVCPAGTASYAMPATLDVEEDCVVSAIRVESKFSDEEDSHGKECPCVSAGGHTISKHHVQTCSPPAVEEEEFETEFGIDADDSWNSGDEEENQTGALGCNTVLANLRNVGPEDGVESTEGSSNAGSNRDAFKGDIRRSSWGSSLDDSDLPKEEVVNTLHQKRDAGSSHLKPEGATMQSKSSIPRSNKDHLDTSWDSSFPVVPSPNCVSPHTVKGEPVPSLGLCSTSTPLSNNRPAKATVDESEWDSSSENNDPNDNGSFTKGDLLSSLSKTNIATVNQTGQLQCADGSYEEANKENVENESNGRSHVVSPVAEDEKNTRGQTQDNDDEGSNRRSSQTDGKLFSEKEEAHDESWDEKDVSDESGTSRPRSAINCESEEEEDSEAPPSMEDGDDEYPKGDGLEEERLAGVEKDNETSEDSDSLDQKLQYDFASATVKVADDDDEENEARLTAYVPLENRSAVDPQPRVSSDDLDEEAAWGNASSSPATKGGFTASQLYASDGSACSDEAVPRTDIDDVDVDSPDEAESIGTRSQKNEYSSEDEGDGDQGEEDVSDKNDEHGESRDFLPTTALVTEKDISKDKRRDFLSELGLEKEEEEQDSWDSESHSENPNMPRARKQSMHTQDQEQMPTVKAKSKENLFYIPSFLRGERGNGMAVLEPRRSVGRPRGSQVEINDGSNGGQHVEEDVTTQKETEKTKWETLRVLNKLEGDGEQKTDLMEELGLGNVDDFEDASDWDSASTASRRTLPGSREQFPECIYPSVKEQDEEAVPAAPLTPERSINSHKTMPTTPQQPGPQPQPLPRARKMVLQKAESEGESDLEQDNVESTCNSDKIQLQNIAELQTGVPPGFPQRPPMVKDSKKVELQKEIDDAIDTCELDLNGPCGSGPVSSGGRERDAHFRAQRNPEERNKAGDIVPWENRYEKLWVEVEKREVKSTFKHVAGELKEKFGELLKSRSSAGDVAEDEPAESTPAEEESSGDEDEGEVIVRPMARARSTVLLPIAEQRESGPESTDDSVCEDEMPLSEPPEGNMFREPDLGEGRPRDAIHMASTDDRCGPVTDRKRSAKLGPFQKPHLDLISMDGAVKRDEAERKDASSDEDPEEVAKSAPTPLGRRSGSVPGVSDEEHKDHMERCKREVAKEKAAASEVNKSTTSCDTGGMALEEAAPEKPESRSGSLSSRAGATHQEEQSAKSTNGAPVLMHSPPQQTYNSSRQEGEAVEETLQPQLVRGASRAPLTSAHDNGDPLSVFDDSTLSELSDDEGRDPKAGKPNTENPEEVDMAEDFDELTQSSDTATDDVDSPTSGYRHASVLIQTLDSATLDSRSMVKLQNIFHEYERCIQKARSRHGYLSDKVSQLEMERAELKRSLEEVKDVKSALERNQLELQTEVTNLKFQLKQEVENRRNATMMYNTTKDKLRRMEEQQQLEVQERQKVELSLRNLQLEMRTLVNNMKQLEEDHSETQRLLAHERSARTLQENLLSSHLRKQQEIEEDNKRNISKSNEALSQLTEASDRERELMQQSVTLQDQLTTLRSDHERLRANSSLKESHLSDENEALKEQLEDVRRDLKLNSEALTQTVFNCNNQVTTLKSELAMATSRLEIERQTRETLDSEVESARIRLAGAVKQAELSMAAHTDLERVLLREKEEHQRFKDRITGEAASQREAITSLSQKLARAESGANSMENEVHRATLQLTEKSLLLEVLQREKDQGAARIKELESALQSEREQIGRVGARQEAAQERLAQTQSEGMLLRQQLEEAQNKGVAKERAVTDAQERFSDILAQLRSDSEERVQLVEERSKELASKAADLRDQIYRLEEEKNERETSLRQLQQELADSLKKLSMSEASLEVNTRYRNDLEEEKARLFKDLDRVKGKLEESEDQYVQAEKRINCLKNVLDEKEKELAAAAQRHQAALSASAASEITIKQLEEAMQQLEIENARLEAAAKQQSNKIETLQKGAQESAMLSDCAPGGGVCIVDVRGHLEDLVSNLQSNKMNLEDQLTREVQKRGTLSHTAQDSQALWEEELKSRSKLGLRLAELEKEKGDLSTQMEIEKKKAKKIAEQKKAVDIRLDQEMNRNTDLQKEMYRFRTLLKTAKKKLRDQETGGAEYGSPISGLQTDQGRQGQAEGAFGLMKERLDDLQLQLKKEGSRRSQLEKANSDLTDQLASLKSLSCSNDQLERSRRQLEEEVLDLRRRMEASQMDQSQVERVRQDAEERARQEINQKLEQVNIFLQSQAASQEALDQIKATNEANLRSQLEQKIRELEGELGRARTTHHDSLSQRDSTRAEVERLRHLYAEELRLRKSLVAKLERANRRLAEANSKLLITSSLANGSLGGPSLDVGSLGSPAHYGATLGPLNRSLGLGRSLLSPVTDGQSSRVEDYLAKMQSELDKNISKELNNAAAELDVSAARLSPVGSSSRGELDPASRATQQYLEVLKKNRMI
ncbi:ankyrin repeat domain-containing protein 26 isoform X6 [Gasterosteus aculeatus]